MADTSSGGAFARLEQILIDDWRRVLKRAWSVRLLALSFVFDGLEAAINMMVTLKVEPPIAPGRFAIVAGLATAAAGLARFIRQKKET